MNANGSVTFLFFTTAGGTRTLWGRCRECACRFIVAWLAGLGIAGVARASDHLDSPATVANPQADIADVYGWMSPDRQRLNLVMTLQGHTFSDKVEYTLHVDSGKAYGHTTVSTRIACRFTSATAVKCRLGAADTASGDPSRLGGLQSQKRRFHVYAGLRDDPFYNNIKGLAGAYQAAADAIKAGTAVDDAGCARFDATASQTIREQMGHTDGGPAQNFLLNWSVSALVFSVDLNAVAKGGSVLAVWGETSASGRRIDRMARPFVENTLLGVAPFSTDDASGMRRQKYNEASPANGSSFVADLQKSLAFQDSLDGDCGNQLLAEAGDGASRYRTLARVFSDDRLWINSASSLCTQFFAVELAALARQEAHRNDCGGRSPTYDTSNVWRSLLIAGRPGGLTDGLARDEHAPSATAFPFLAAPDAHRVDH